MGPNFKTFTDQMLLIKISEEKPGLINPFYKRVLKNAVAFGAGAGLGSGGAYMLSDALLPKILPKLSPKQRSLLAGGAALLSGAATGLTSLSAYKTMRRAEQEEDEWLRKKELWKRQK